MTRVAEEEAPVSSRHRASCQFLGDNALAGTQPTQPWNGEAQSREGVALATPARPSDETSRVAARARRV